VRTDIKTRQAVLSSLNEGAAKMFEMVANDSAFRNSTPGREFVAGLLSIVGKKGDAGETTRVVNALQTVEPLGVSFELTMLLANSVAQQDASLETVVGPSGMNPLFGKASAVAADPAASASERAKGLRLLAMRSSVDASLAATVVRRWPYQDKLPDRQALLGALLSRPEWTAAVMSGIQIGLIPRDELSVEQIRFLLLYPNVSVQTQAAGFFNDWNSLKRLPVVSRYQGSLGPGANAEHGHGLFLQNCQSCHSTADEPAVDHSRLNLSETPALTKEKLLAGILNPNGKPTTTHPLILVQTKNGELLPGFITAQTSKSITICDWQGNIRDVALSNIAAQGTLHLSAMPEGWESSLTSQDMADLLEYFTSGRK
jgi:putative heme-binding domain-containing protein